MWASCQCTYDPVCGTLNIPGAPVLSFFSSSFSLKFDSGWHMFSSIGPVWLYLGYICVHLCIFLSFFKMFFQSGHAIGFYTMYTENSWFWLAGSCPLMSPMDKYYEAFWNQDFNLPWRFCIWWYYSFYLSKYNCRMIKYISCSHVQKYAKLDQKWKNTLHRVLV